MATKKTKPAAQPSLGIKPIKSNIIMEAVKKDTVSKGGIVLAAADAEAVSKGKVLAVGPDVTLIEVGQTILPNWQNAKKVKFEMAEYWIADEDDIVLIFEGE
jgi:chaperonin GroES